MHLRRFLVPLVLSAAVSAGACSSGSDGITAPVTPTPTGDTTPPAIVREMRGVWIATVANIDWPTRTGLSAGQQQVELVDLLDRARNAGLNAVMFHVRPAADAVYQSSLEPWAAMLSGVQGQDPGFDPLAFAVREAHARGLELHAWINPFRAGNTKDSALFAPLHLFRTRRDLVRVYGTQLWLDPGEQAVHDHSINVVRDIVERYDIDGVHADDYFYPYQQTDAQNRVIDFPDSASYARSGSTLSRADWRRNNVDRFVERLYSEVHRIKPTMKVGISPFGIWRPGFPSGINGLDAFATIYADSRKWLQQGWVDYLAPQLYWAISAAQQSYPLLLDWWLAQNPTGRHVWPGLAAYRVAEGTYNNTEIPGQISATRQRTGGSGHILYNANSTLKYQNGSVAASLATLYASRALVPAYTWLDGVPPSAPTMTVSGGSMQMLPGPGESPRWWVVRSRAQAKWSTQIVFGDVRTFALPANTDRAVLNAVDQAGNLSTGVQWKAP